VVETNVTECLGALVVKFSSFGVNSVHDNSVVIILKSACLGLAVGVRIAVFGDIDRLAHQPVGSEVCAVGQQRQIRPRVVAEFEDAALMKVMAVDEKGFAPVPTVVAAEAISRYRLQRIGSTEECKEQFYAITAERRIVHPAAVVITANAQRRLFAPAGKQR